MGNKKMIPIIEWARNHFDPIPSTSTLRVWAKSGMIIPPATKVGREWRVRADAIYSPMKSAHAEIDLSPRALEILRKLP